jgi:hypothetical protein
MNSNITLSFLLIYGWKICKSTVTAWENFCELLLPCLWKLSVKEVILRNCVLHMHEQNFILNLFQVISFSVTMYIWIPNSVLVLGQNVTQIKAPLGESKIVFPGQEELFTPEVSGQQPKCADEEGFCESADNYPRLVVMLSSTVHHNMKLIHI